MNTGIVYAMVFISALFVYPKKQKLQSMDFKANRLKMVSEQITSRGITDSNVVEAMQDVERHLFVPKNLWSYAYQDRPLPIGHAQTISQPYIVGLMSQLLETNKKQKILEIGTGSGYQAAVLACIAKEVYTIEIVEDLAKKSAILLDSLGYKNVHVKFDDGYKGWPEEAPFDGIIVTCSPTNIPPALIEQLKEDGKLVIPIGRKDVKKLVLLTKTNGKIVKTNVIPVRFVPMVNEKGNKY